MQFVLLFDIFKLVYFYLLSVFSKKYNNKKGADGVHRCVRYYLPYEVQFPSRNF